MNYETLTLFTIGFFGLYSHYGGQGGWGGKGGAQNAHAPLKIPKSQNDLSIKLSSQ